MIIGLYSVLFMFIFVCVLDGEKTLFWLRGDPNGSVHADDRNCSHLFNSVCHHSICCQRG